MSKFLKWITEKKIVVPMKWSLLLIISFSFIITYIMLCLAPGLANTVWEIFSENKVLYFYNYIPVLLLLLFAFFLFNNVILSVSISSTLLISLSIINSVKIQLRQEPFLPTDISLATEVVALLDKFNTSFVLSIIGIIVFAVLIILLSVLFFKGATITLKTRMIGLVTCIIVGTCFNYTIYNNERLYDKFTVEGNYYFKVNHYLSKGFLYSFLVDFNSRIVQKPEGYSSFDYSSINGTPADYSDAEKPNIVMIMGEAFSDISINENIDFDEYEDPLKNYKQITSEEDTISGHIVVPNFGGGTADTEFDVLSGCPTSFINNDLPSYSFINKKFDNLTNQLKNLGYQTMAIHPGNYWFYNRANVYEHMGFDDFDYLEKDFDLSKQGIAGYISDESTTNKIIDEFEKHTQNNETPFFEFAVTIQNHGPFTNKYGIKKNFNTDLNVTDEQINMLSNYFRGVSDADKQIADLVSYFEQSEEPVVLVYFGDHLPGFPSGLELFQDFGYDIDIDGTMEQRMNMYKTPFMIWMNDSAKEMTNFEENKDSLALPEEVTINASYLGTTVMELIGFNGISPLFDFANELRKELPVVTEQGIMDSESNYLDTLTNEQNSAVEKLKGWVYYKLFDENVN